VAEWGKEKGERSISVAGIMHTYKKITKISVHYLVPSEFSQLKKEEKSGGNENE